MVSAVAVDVKNRRLLGSRTLGVSTTFIFMTRYFIAANVWLALAIVAILGCTNRSTEHYAMSSFFSGPAIGASSFTFIEFVQVSVLTIDTFGGWS
jgi:hypothetical protein